MPRIQPARHSRAALARRPTAVRSLDRPRSATSTSPLASPRRYSCGSIAPSSFLRRLNSASARLPKRCSRFLTLRRRTVIVVEVQASYCRNVQSTNCWSNAFGLPALHRDATPVGFPELRSAAVCDADLSARPAVFLDWLQRRLRCFLASHTFLQTWREPQWLPAPRFSKSNLGMSIDRRSG
jgi:hypothetical protein